MRMNCIAKRLSNVMMLMAMPKPVYVESQMTSPYLNAMQQVCLLRATASVEASCLDCTAVHCIVQSNDRSQLDLGVEENNIKRFSQADGSP